MFNSKNIFFQIDLATTLGLEKAIFIQQLHELIKNLESFEDTLSWLKITHVELHRLLPFWTIEEIKKISHELMENEYIFIEDDSLSINYNKLNTNTNVVTTENIDSAEIVVSENMENFKLSTAKNSNIVEQESNYKRPHALREQGDQYIKEIDRVVTHFDFCRKKIQKNYVRVEFGNKSGEYLLRLHLAETGRTPDMFNGAIRWLFSDDKEAKFWRDATMNIGALIKNYNSIEMKYISGSKESKMSQDMKEAVEFYRQKGYTDKEIEEGLKNGTL